jgi:hypothetical protein
MLISNSTCNLDSEDEIPTNMNNFIQAIAENRGQSAPPLELTERVTSFFIFLSFPFYSIYSEYSGIAQVTRITMIPKSIMNSITLTLLILEIPDYSSLLISLHLKITPNFIGIVT